MSTKLIVAGFVGVAIVAGSTAGVGSYLATKSSMSASAGSLPSASSSTSVGTVAPARTTATPSSTSSPAQAPTSVVTPTQTADAVPKALSPKSQVPLPTRTSKPTTPKPARTTPKPSRTTPQAEACIYDSTWAARQERNRIAREAQMYNYNVEINMAINSGDMDEATRLQDELSALQERWAEDDSLDPEPKC